MISKGGSKISTEASWRVSLTQYGVGLDDPDCKIL